MRLILLSILLSTACSTLQVVDTNNPNEKHIISPLCVGTFNIKERVMICRDYDLTAMEFIGDEYEIEIDEDELRVNFSVEQWEELLAFALEQGWINRDDGV